MNNYSDVLDKLKSQFERKYDFKTQESQADFIEGMLEFAKLICSSAKFSEINISSKPEEHGGEITKLSIIVEN